MKNRTESVAKPLPVAPAATTSTPATISQEQKHQNAARIVANVGETYRALAKSSGEIPGIADPLRSAKNYLAVGNDELALSSANQAWTTLKNYRKSDPLETYEVVRGDTLWRIARDHSPVRQGPGWVTIWKANKNTVKNFDRIDVGLNLKIPSQSAQYVTPYWKPRNLATAKVEPLELPRGDGKVDLVELPIPYEDGRVELAELPLSDEIIPDGFVVAALPHEPVLVFYPRAVR